MTNLSSPNTASETPGPEVYRVMLVDDSFTIRSVTALAFKGDPQINVVASVSNGQLAVEALRRNAIDVIVLDIEMPVMDGITALPLLKAVDPTVQIIMASTLAQKNAEISLRALSTGASDYIPKPMAGQELFTAADFKRELIDKIKVFGAKSQRLKLRSNRTQADKSAPALLKKLITLRKEEIVSPAVIAIGSSTGGPNALIDVIKDMGSGLPQPIVITQHMPPTFTQMLAQHIQQKCNVQCSEAKDGDVLKNGHYYVAPGDYHMLLAQKLQGVTVQLVKDPAENYCRPSVDPMLRSLITVYGKKILVVMLTGMGQDGMKGSEQVVKAGGSVIAQDEATSVVWGMPGAVTNAGLCSAVLPLLDIGQFVKRAAMKKNTI